jgi:hypothetical protein
LAQQFADKGLALNPKVVQSQVIAKYVKDSQRTFPDLNLYFFSQI